MYISYLQGQHQSRMMEVNKQQTRELLIVIPALNFIIFGFAMCTRRAFSSFRIVGKNLTLHFCYILVIPGARRINP